jgi:outer membrane protein
MMRTIHSIFLALLVAVVVWSGPALAASPKIGVIDTKRVLKESKAAQEARTAIMQDLREKQTLYRDKEKEILRMRETYTRDKDNLTTDEAKERQADLAKGIKELSRLKSDLEEELNRKNRDLTRDILQEIVQVVKELRKDEKYTLILEKGSTVAWDEEIDITEEIIERYDKLKQ